MLISIPFILADPYILSYDPEKDEHNFERISLLERMDLALGTLESVILGYAYSLEQ